jgi:NAD-dependent deacetylase sirtuin 2
MKPKPFYHLAKEMYPGKFKPTLSHYFIYLLEQKGLLLRSYTQVCDYKHPSTQYQFNVQLEY